MTWRILESGWCSVCLKGTVQAAGGKQEGEGVALEGHSPPRLENALARVVKVT